MEIFLTQKQLAELKERYPGMSPDDAFNKVIETALRKKFSAEYHEAESRTDWIKTLGIAIVVATLIWLLK
jgi:hypothetical protein